MVIGAVLAAGVLVAPQVLLLIFAGVLVAVFLRSGGGWIATRSGLPYHAGVAIFLAVLILALAGAFAAFAPAVMTQTNELFDQIPSAAKGLRDWVRAMPGAKRCSNAQPRAACGRPAAAMPRRWP